MPNTEQVPMGDLYLRWKGKWIHKAKICRLCEMLLATDDIIDKHRYVCTVLNSRLEVKLPHKLKGTGRKVRTPDGLFTLEQAAKFYKITEEAIRYRIKKWGTWSYADTQN